MQEHKQAETMFKETTFKEKVALITGGRSGIGFQIARDMLNLGAKVIICSRKEELLSQAAKELVQWGEVSYKTCDIRKTEDIAELITFIKEKYNCLDLLVNNAGGQFSVKTENLSDNGWNAVINNNLNGTFYMTRDVGKAFFIPQKSGVIVNIVADIWRGFPGMIHTGAARAGVENMTKTIAQEWAQYNVRINCVAPGIVDTTGLEEYPTAIKELFEESREIIPMKRFAKVSEISNAVCFLASPLSSYISGVTLYVDGAKHLNYDKMGLIKALNKMEKPC